MDSASCNPRVVDHCRQVGEIDYCAQPGSIGPVWIRGQELIRRIFVTVRNQHWAEISPNTWQVMEVSPELLNIEAQHSSENVEFKWKGAFAVHADAGTIDFSFQGRVLRDVDICRIGLVVLLPAPAIEGAKLRIAGPGGIKSVAIENGISPQAIVNGLPTGITEPFWEIRVRSANGSFVSIALRGDLFELEDQRNWGDSSFKIYCTPLGEGFPRHLSKGTIISQAARITYNLSDAAKQQRSDAAGVKISKGTRNQLFPEIGIEASALEFDKLKAPWRYIALDIDSALCADEIPRGQLIDLGITTEFLSKRQTELVEFLKAHGVIVVTVRLRGGGDAPPRRQDVDELKKVLRASGHSRVPILATTRGHFVEFNRAGPLNLDVGGVAFPVSPTVHSDAWGTAFENGPIVGDMVVAARALVCAPLVEIAPLTWKYPAGPYDAEPQQVFLWLLEAIVSATLTHANRITLSAADVLRIFQNPPLREWLARLVSYSEKVVLPFAADHQDLLLLALKDDRAIVILVNLGRKPLAINLPAEWTFMKGVSITQQHVTNLSEAPLQMRGTSGIIAEFTVLKPTSPVLISEQTEA